MNILLYKNVIFYDTKWIKLSRILHFAHGIVLTKKEYLAFICFITIHEVKKFIFRLIMFWYLFVSSWLHLTFRTKNSNKVAEKVLLVSKDFWFLIKRIHCAFYEYHILVIFLCQWYIKLSLNTFFGEKVHRRKSHFNYDDDIYAFWIRGVESPAGLRETNVYAPLPHSSVYLSHLKKIVE
jgi:hypothetical protein